MEKLIHKPSLEVTPKRRGFSWRYRYMKGPQSFCTWHCHDEYELVLHRDLLATARIGNVEETISHNHIMLIGPNIPHSIDPSLQNDDSERHMFWFSHKWINDMMYNCEEFRRLTSLLKRAQKCVVFSETVAEKVFTLVNDEQNSTPLEQLATLIRVLSLITNDNESSTLLTHIHTSEGTDSTGRAKIEKVCDYIAKHYHHPITLSDIAKAMHCSESSIHRLFSTHFSESFSCYLRKFRLGVACDKLISTHHSVSIISEAVGYNNLSNFNRQFKQYKGMSPREFRKQYQPKPVV
ncbi:AraC family transcriptional regulator [Veronia nyctiphanis]|uniref:AraC family transcriptional regulator n=1 Tax=Veronia nyctiphanis TaxID=1278244 RepID=A0A4Q0YQ37_9GAMM|nr:AraC family transcriptional regulator [Veronia nyctiphanis]RXJ73200.1 AraC family transcriptional regulator [Veronia nyctiphanis]